MGEKKIKGRKRHISCDTIGNLLYIKVHRANIHDTIAGVNIFYQTFKKYSSIKGFSADQGYRGTSFNFVTEHLKLKMDIPRKTPNQFKILKKRWIVERVFGWIGNSRRLSKDFEINTLTSENMFRIAMIGIALGKIF